MVVETHLEKSIDREDALKRRVGRLKDNIGNFQGGGTGEADNYSGIRLSKSLQVGTTGSILLGIPSQQWRTKVQAIFKGPINL